MGGRLLDLIRFHVSMRSATKALRQREKITTGGFRLTVCHRAAAFQRLMQRIDLSQTAEGSLGGHQLNLTPPVRLVMLPLHGFIWLCSVRLKISPNTSESCSSRLGITWLSARAFEIEMLRSWLKARCGWEQRRGRAYQTGLAAERHTQRAGMEINVTAVMIFCYTRLCFRLLLGKGVRLDLC